MAEQILIDHRNRIRRKHVKELLKNTKRNTGYQHKLNYINQHIDSDFLFFKYDTTPDKKAQTDDYTKIK